MSVTSMRSIDTNILLRHRLQDHDDHSPRASALLQKVRRGQHTIFCPTTVIFEAIYILHVRNDIAWALNNLIDLPNYVMRVEDVVLDALEFWVNQSSLDYADCSHLALTKELGMTEIYTFDRKMDQFPGVERIEP